MHRVVFDLMDSCLGKNHHLFFDNFSTTAKLFQYLEKRVSYASGTIRKDGGLFPVSLIQTFSTVKQSIFHVDYLLVVVYCLSSIYGAKESDKHESRESNF